MRNDQLHSIIRRMILALIVYLEQEDSAAAKELLPVIQKIRDEAEDAD